MPTQAPVRKKSFVASQVTPQQQLTVLESQLDHLKAQVRQAQQIGGLGTAALMLVHEASNLLTPVVNYSQTALSSNDMALMKKALQVTVTNGRMLVAMSERLLEIGAAKTSNARMSSVREAIEDAKASLCRDFSKDGIRFTCDMDPTEMVWMDPLHLRQVLFNLFINAREALKGNHQGRLTVHFRREAGTVQIEVTDTGKGIPSESIPQVFEPLHSSKPGVQDGRARCSGLGLALCRDLVEQAGGSIRVASEPGKGTTFCITLTDRPYMESRPTLCPESCHWEPT